MLTLFLVSMVAMVNATPTKAVIIKVPTDKPTIQEAIDAASSGDEIYVLAGIYEERIVMKYGVNVIGEGADVTVIRSDGIVVTGASNAVLQGFNITGGYIGVDAYGVSRFCILDNIITKIRNVGYTSALGVHIGASDSVSICRNEISDIKELIGYDRNAMGIFVEDSTSTTIYRNRVFDIEDTGQWGAAGIGNARCIGSVIVGNIVYDVIENDYRYNFGISENPGESATIAYNTVANILVGGYDPGASRGIFIYGPNTVTGNIVAYLNRGRDPSTGIYNYLDAGTVTYNYVWSIDVDGIPFNGSHDAVSNKVADPLFVDFAARDFHLQADSPCLEASETGKEIGAYGAPCIECCIPVEPVPGPLFSNIVAILPLGIVAGAVVIRRRRKANN
ncbi:MAG: right-handed parallel beta-helix repeat-containing protein [Candidatus Hodarchaeota archaeon]